MNLSEFYSYRFIGKLTGQPFSSMIKSRVRNIFTKVEALRINLNTDGASITSKSHTHPSHS